MSGREGSQRSCHQIGIFEALKTNRSNRAPANADASGRDFFAGIVVILFVNESLPCFLFQVVACSPADVNFRIGGIEETNCPDSEHSAERFQKLGFAFRVDFQTEQLLSEFVKPLQFFAMQSGKLRLSPDLRDQSCDHYTRDQERSQTRYVDRTVDLERKERVNKEVIQAGDGYQRHHGGRSKIARQRLHDQDNQIAKADRKKTEMQLECNPCEQ